MELATKEQNEDIKSVAHIILDVVDGKDRNSVVSAMATILSLCYIDRKLEKERFLNDMGETFDCHFSQI